MRFLRLLMILSVFFSIAHTSAMAGTHVVLEMEPYVSAMDKHSGTHDHCCTDHSEQAPDCHTFAGLLPALAKREPMPETSDDVSADNSVVPDGVEPAGPLDPPRRS